MAQQSKIKWVARQRRPEQGTGFQIFVSDLVASGVTFEECKMDAQRFCHLPSHAPLPPDIEIVPYSLD